MTTDRAKRYAANRQVLFALFDHVLGRSKPSAEALACRCRGDCPCHALAQLGGVPCPPSCPHFGDHFDGCHRCDDACNQKPARRFDGAYPGKARGPGFRNAKAGRKMASDYRRQFKGVL